MEYQGKVENFMIVSSEFSERPSTGTAFHVSASVRVIGNVTDGVITEYRSNLTPHLR